MTATARTAGPPSATLRRNREFRLLWVGQALSSFGSMLSLVALPLVLLAKGEPTTLVALVGTAVAVAGLVARIPAGLVSDRYPERGLLIGCEVVRLVGFAAITVWILVRPLSLWLAVAVVVVAAGAAEVFKPTQLRVVRRVVSAEQLPSAISLNQARSYAAAIAGPATAGLLIGLLPVLPFAVDALTFLVSAVCIAAVVPRRRTAARPRAGAIAPVTAPGPGTAEQGFWLRFTMGWRYLWADAFLRRSVLYFSGLTLVSTALDSALVLGVGREHGGAQLVGWSVSTAAIAGLVGSLATPRLQRVMPLRAMVASGPAAGGALLFLAWLTGSTLVFVAGFCVTCLLVPVVNATVSSVITLSVPEEVFGRVATANDFVVQLLQPLGPLVAGVLVSQSLPLAALVLAVAFVLLAGLAAALPARTTAPAAEPAWSAS